LNERLLCERLRISRTPLREAMKTLAAEGLVTLLPNRGAIVAAIDAREVADLFGVMGALEALAGDLACAHATEAEIAEIAAIPYRMRLHFTRRERAQYFACNQSIHEKIFEAAHNAVLLDVYRKLAGRLRRARYAANLSDTRWAQAMAEHDGILAALTGRDGPGLSTLLAAHLRNKLDAVCCALAAAPEPPERRTAVRSHHAEAASD
jgi:DNA-binding GntR family transcriptional regulator